MKSFTKKLSLILPNVEYVPRGQTNIGDLFSKALYLGHKNFLKTTNTKTPNKIILQEYVKDESFRLYKKYQLEPISTEINISVISLKALKDINKPKEIFSFLNSSYSKDSLLEVNKEEDIVSFKYDEKEVGFSFKMEEIK